ncbi:DUF2274 domain-containing protein [Oleomonas cavernae]|uniref:DUF2274 domain-containing protein n=1 Tax=Oleomonas cavernae TaxID=2320859 RepID=A0A418WHE2_9PROT|nr:DUF2274 domain-containing protein [Oleomonas cavernae]RJF89299.1 DUF2274 domain-containing protein [Oleomonas cavernae]
MTKLKLGPFEDDKVVRATVELPASLHRDLVAYVETPPHQIGQAVTDPLTLIVRMLQRFIATDRGFAKAKKPKSTLLLTVSSDLASLPR